MAQRDETMLWTVDGDDVITAVDGGWDAFAERNGAPWLTSAGVVGRNLFDFFAGDTTQRLHRLLLHHVRRSRESIDLRLRCDSPVERRLGLLTLAPGAAGVIEFRSSLVESGKRAPLRLLDPLEPRSSAIVDSCSICQQIRVPGTGWLEADIAVARLELDRAAAQPRLGYGLCESCSRDLIQRIRPGDPAP